MTLSIETRRVSMVAALLAAAACYRYTPIESGAVPVGSEFRASLTEDGTTRLVPTLGAQVAKVEGRVLSNSDTAFVISISATTNRSNVQTFWTGETITIPRATIQSIEARKLDRKRTWLVTTLGLVGGFLAAQIFGLFEGSASGGDGGPPPPPP